jgi:hypothetical protein
MKHNTVKTLHKSGLYTIMAVFDDRLVHYYEIRRLAYRELPATQTTGEPSRVVEPYNVTQGAWKLDALVAMLEAYIAKQSSE